MEEEKVVGKKKSKKGILILIAIIIAIVVGIVLFFMFNDVEIDFDTEDEKEISSEEKNETKVNKEKKNEIEEKNTTTKKSSKENNGKSSSEIYSDIAGEWESAATGGSYYVFEDDKTFYWYKSSKDLEDNYYKGTIKATVGQDAIDELGVSYEQVMNVIVLSEGQVTLKDIYCLELNPTYLISDGVDKSSTLENRKMKLLFIKVDDEYAQAYNYNTGDRYDLNKK